MLNFFTLALVAWRFNTISSSPKLMLSFTINRNIHKYFQSLQWCLFCLIRLCCVSKQDMNWPKISLHSMLLLVYYRWHRLEAYGDQSETPVTLSEKFLNARTLSEIQEFEIIFWKSDLLYIFKKQIIIYGTEGRLFIDPARCL